MESLNKQPEISVYFLERTTNAKSLGKPHLRSFRVRCNMLVKKARCLTLICTSSSVRLSLLRFYWQSCCGCGCLLDLCIVFDHTIASTETTIASAVAYVAWWCDVIDARRDVARKSRDSAAQVDPSERGRHRIASSSQISHILARLDSRHCGSAAQADRAGAPP